MSKSNQTPSFSDDIQQYYSLFNVSNPHDLMLCVIFNMLWGLRYKQDKHDPDAIEQLKAQRAIFELACKHSGR
jgi:hypothetical protein